MGYTFQELSIRAKLILITVATAVLSHLVGVAFLLIHDVNRIRDDARAEISTVTTILQDHALTALLLQKEDAGRSIMRWLAALPHVEDAAILTSHERVFASFDRSGDGIELRPEVSLGTSTFLDGVLHSKVPLVRKGTTIGSLYLRSSNNYLFDRVQAYYHAAGWVLLIVLGVAFLVAMELQRSIAGPLGELTATVREIARSRDFSRRSELRRQDEIGILANWINSMLDMLQRHESERNRAVVRLEQANKELREATLKAEAASYAKSEFLANMSHEIRTPLNGIVSLTELLMLSELDEEQHLDVSTIRSSAQSLKRVINDVLDFSKIEAGKLLIEHRRFNLSETIDHVLDLMRVEIEAKRLEFLSFVDDAQGKSDLLGDAARLQQVLMNLLSNAIKFTPVEGALVLRVEVSSLGTEKAVVHICVADTGIGIPAEKLDLIFDSFTQADGSTTRKYGGTGLGLTISKRIVELMNGQIWVKSIEGAGSAFHVLLQLPCATSQTAPLLAEESENKGRAYRILLAEDNEVNQDTVARFLQLQGHSINVARNGVEALEKWEQGEFDIILMDLQMPDMGGIEATERIRAAHNGKENIPIIAVTAQVLPGTQRLCSSAGMDGYVTKPIDFKDLLRAIEDVLEVRKFAQEYDLLSEALLTTQDDGQESQGETS